ncbi:rhomboid family intramembrane serine protease [Roseovarius sp.]|uniref:rhomboid family intramembrane serine protease n=1 Tax=Roseovarius sp. TaxID=1486281 RepID=UPI0026398C9B|nr:rhomboid family intramembrane serine protease [Roseovarius sp.]
MFPIRDHNPSGRTPYVTYALIALNVVIFIGYWPLFNDARALNQFFFDWAMIPARVTQMGEYSGLFTSMFLHGGLMHLVGNMLFLWIFGDNMEDRMGHLPYLAFYLVSGMGASLAQVLAGPLSMVPMVGASGAIAGVMGGYLLLFPFARVDILVIFIVFFRIITIPAAILLVLWFATQLFSGIGVDAGNGGVAYWAHAGGFVIGAALTLPLFLRLGGRRFWNMTDGKPPHPEADYTYRRTSIPRVRYPK